MSRNKFASVMTSAPPGVRLPFWERNKKRRVAGHLGRALQVITYNPNYRATAALAGLGAIFSVWAGSWMLLAVTGLSAAVVVAQFWPERFEQSLRGWWRSNRRYRWWWGRTVRRCGAAKLDTPLPLLVSTRSTQYVDKLKVRVPTGLDPVAFQQSADLLQWGWRGLSTRVYNPQPKWQMVELWNLVKDPLIEPVKPFPRPVKPLPKRGLPLLKLEDGQPWHWKLRGGAASMYVCGISGSGKGSIIGAILDQLDLGIEEKIVEVLGIDPQGSELGMWRHKFSKLVYSKSEAVAMVEDLVRKMDKRTWSMFGITRQHTPKKDDPLYLLIVDEGLDLLDKSDRDLHRRLVRGFRELARQGRKASIVVAFFAQRAELEFAEIRKEFPIAIALEQLRDIDVDIVLGRGALAAGAKAHEITLPGEAYVAEAGGIARGRAPQFTDDYIKESGQDADPDTLPKPPSQKYGGVLIA